MVKAKFDPDRVIGKQITQFGRQELCDFVAKLCEYIKADVGAGVYRGGIYPENISIDENGGIAVGPAKREDWTGQELEFLPPELYWNGKRAPAADVYSIGLLMYYAVTGGKLPFEGKCRDPQLRRMGGDEFEVPKEAGRRLGEIIGKSTRFKAAERYQSMDEMRVMAESCLKNLYLNGASSAEVIFKKNDDDLTEIEKLMVDIIEKEEDTPIPAPENNEADSPAEETLKEETPKEETEAVEEIPSGAAADDDFEVFIPQNEPDEDEADLEPVYVERDKKGASAVQYTRNAEKERDSAEKYDRRKRRPVAVILVLCAVLVIVSILFNALIKDLTAGTQEVQKAAESIEQGDYSSLIDDDEPAASAVNITPPPVDTSNDLDIEPDPSEAPYIPGEASGTAQSSEQVEHHYEIFVEDVSWEQAEEKCEALGGHLVVINDADEFAEVTQLASDAGVTYVWIGGHRENGTVVWVDSSTEVYEKWAYGEPSYTDNGVAEDYMLLWNNRGWSQNDSRNDPCKDFAHMYSGKIAYICEYGG